MTKQQAVTARKKPKCIKGTACGYSCISGKYLCSSKVLARDAAALVALATTSDVANKYIARLPARSSSARPEGSFGKDNFTEAEQKTLAKGLENALLDSEIRIRFNASGLLKVLESGTVLTSFVTGRSGGDSATDPASQRVSTELAKLGVPATRSAELDLERPVYGYFSTQDEPDSSDESDALSSYGEVIVRLKPSAKQRSSFTLGDSFGNTGSVYSPEDESYSYSHYNVASPLTSVNLEVLPTKLYTSKEKAAFQALATGQQAKLSDLTSSYIEAQIHGGVTLSDIATVMIPSGMETFSKYDAEDFKKLTKSLTDKGISFEIYENQWSY